jgi:hypothetical protein
VKREREREVGAESLSSFSSTSRFSLFSQELIRWTMVWYQLSYTARRFLSVLIVK